MCVERGVVGRGERRRLIETTVISSYQMGRLTCVGV